MTGRGHLTRLAGILWVGQQSNTLQLGELTRAVVPWQFGVVQQHDAVCKQMRRSRLLSQGQGSDGGYSKSIAQIKVGTHSHAMYFIGCMQKISLSLPQTADEANLSTATHAPRHLQDFMAKEMMVVFVHVKYFASAVTYRLCWCGRRGRGAIGRRKCATVHVCRCTRWPISAAQLHPPAGAHTQSQQNK